ncbi:MAG: LuxR family transcriptional regulator [Rhizobiales bacterium]|nr:LuxR family transcriptional regulator [Hyphomicrobiales bacterium]
MQRNIPLDQVGQWSRAIAAAATANSPEELASRFACGARALIDSDLTYVGIYRREGASVTIDAGGIDRWNRDYDAHLFRLDPFFQTFLETQRDFLLPLAVFDPTAFRRSPYYRDFYEPSESVDEITGVFNLDRRTAAFVTFLRMRGKATFGTAELDAVQAVGEATRVVLDRLHGLWYGQEASDTAGRRFALLSRREREIAELLLCGGCAKSISRRLAISPGTVRNHIKKIYPKLGVHSQVELLALARDGEVAALHGSLPADDPRPDAVLKAQNLGVAGMHDE